MFFCNSKFSNHFRSNFSRDQQNSTHRFKAHHGQGSTKLSAFQWHHFISNLFDFKFGSSVLVILSSRFALFRSSLKSKHRDYNRDINGNVSLPEKVFKGTFVVFTVIALLELPSGVSFQ